MHNPVQGSSSHNASDDIAATKVPQNDAISSNEKIFPIFAEKLASRDPKDFVNTARKLAVWLSSERAYYPGARPKIIELLEIAVASLDTFIHHPSIVELAEYLRYLVQTVIPFKHMFLEHGLQSRLQRIISNPRVSLVRTSTSATSTQAQGIESTGVPPSHMHQPTTPSLHRIQVTSSTMPSTTIGEGAVHMDLSQARNPSEVASSSRIESLTSPVTNTPQDPSENMAFKPQPKRARRAALPEELIARDLDWFKSIQGSLITNSDTDTPLSTAGEFSPALASNTPHVPRQSPSPRRKTARMVPSRLPRRMTLDATQGEVNASASTSLFSSEPLAGMEGPCGNAQDEMDVDEQHPSLKTMGYDNPSRQELSRPDGSSFPESCPVSFLSSKLPIGSPGPQISQMDYQPSVKRSLTNGETAISARSPAPAPEATLHRIEVESMSTSVSDALGSEKPPPEPFSKPESTPPQSPQILRGPILPPLVNALEPPLNLNFRISHESLGQPQQSGVVLNQPRFDGNMTVIHSAQAKPFTHTHMIDISLSERIFCKVSRWVNRRFHSSEPSQGVCIGLGCYRLLEFYDTIKSDKAKHHVEAVTSQLPCSWPSSNRLSLHVRDREKHTIIALSPPLFLTPDQCVDISSLMKLGNNTLEIRQKDDLSEYLFVLHAHHPTRAQLSELDTVKSADERWKRLLDVVSARITPPGKLASEGVAGVS